MNFYKKSKNKVDNIFSSMFNSDNVISNVSSNGSITQISSGNSTVQINGKTYKGNNVKIIGDKVIIDGVSQEVTLSGPTVEVIVQGNCGDITTENGTINVKGTSKEVKTHNGQVTVGGDILGSIKTHNGNVSVKGSIAGNCRTHNGNINSRG